MALGELLDGPADDVVQRLEKYAAVRRERTAKTQLVAREMDGSSTTRPARPHRSATRCSQR